MSFKTKEIVPDRKALLPFLPSFLASQPTHNKSSSVTDEAGANLCHVSVSGLSCAAVVFKTN